MKFPIATTVPHDFSATMLEHASVFSIMAHHDLQPNWAAKYSMQQLIACCNRIDASSLNSCFYSHDNIQEELIQNPAFADYYARLTTLFPEAPPTPPEEPPLLTITIEADTIHLNPRPRSKSPLGAGSC